MALPVLLAGAAIPIGSYAIGELTWKALETLALRAANSYNETMKGLYKEFKELAAEERLDQKLSDMENYNWAQGHYVPSCLHGADRSSSNPNKCSDKKCNSLTQKFKEANSTFIQRMHLLVWIPDHETKWLCVALVIGVATTVFSAAFILPAGTALGLKSAFIFAGSIAGTLSAASTTLSRVRCGCSGSD